MSEIENADEELNEAEELEEPEGIEELKEEAAEESEHSEESSEADMAQQEKAKNAPAHVVKKKRHIVRNIIVTLIVVVVLAAAGCCGYLVWDDSQNASYVPANTTLDGTTDIGGMTRSEVHDAVMSHVKNGSLPSITVKAGEYKYLIRYTAVGEVDFDATEDAAFALRNDSLLTRCLQRAKEIVGLSSASSNDISTVCSVDTKKLTKQVKKIAAKVDVDATEAGYEVDEDARKLVCTKGQNGYKLKVKKTVAKIEEALKAGDSDVTIDAVATVLEPTSTKAGQAIFVDTQKCHLYFYVNGKVKKEYPCSPGKTGYETPKGDFTITQKNPSPTWTNPHSDWSQGMAETIAPGPSNPLGLRALALSCGGGIFIHGTTNLAALGSPDSHGCIRLANEKIVELYDLVDTGIPVFVR